MPSASGDRPVALDRRPSASGDCLVLFDGMPSTAGEGQLVFDEMPSACGRPRVMLDGSPSPFTIDAGESMGNQRVIHRGERQLHPSPATIATERRQAEQQTAEFKDHYRKRSDSASSNEE
jgi:hypothetical protein